MLAQRRWLHILGVIVFYGSLVYLGQVAGEWALDHLELDLHPAKQAAIHRMVIATVALYVLLLALPFMPGVEIGLGLMVMMGPDICLLVYLGTVLALVLSYSVGRLVPMSTIVATFDWFGLTRARDLISQVAPLGAEERLAFLLSRVPVRLLSFLLRHRYLALALVLNLPGNAFVGGGGGIALVAGMSRLFSFPQYVLAITLAVAPVPLVFYLFDGFR